MTMDYGQMLLEYVLVYCTSHGLTAIGEPAVPKTYQPVGDSLHQCSRSKHDSNPDCKPPMPVWIISAFLLLATVKWIASFLIWYLYLVLSTVTAISSTKINLRSALTATGHEDSHRARLHRLARTIKVIGAFKKASSSTSSFRKEEPVSSRPIRTGSVLEVRQELHRRSTECRPLPQPLSKRLSTTSTQTLWTRLISHPCFRGFAPYLTLLIPQWYLSHLIDILLSGLPPSHSPGYGSTSVILTTFFGGGYAVWTHYLITAPSHKNGIFAHFPRGQHVLNDLWPITACWAICEHLPLSIPLALSRWLRLKDVAFDALSWNELAPAQQRGWLGMFALVWVVHVILVIGVALPAMMVCRRFYASMLAEGDFAIVPFVRHGEKWREQMQRKQEQEQEKQQQQQPQKPLKNGSPPQNHNGNTTTTTTTTATTTTTTTNSSVMPYNSSDSSRLRKPGLTVSEAWSTITLQQYLRVLAVYVGWVVVNQVVQLLYWWVNWEMHWALGVGGYGEGRTVGGGRGGGGYGYAGTRLPCSPVGVVEPVILRGFFGSGSIFGGNSIGSWRNSAVGGGWGGLSGGFGGGRSEL